MKDLTAAQKEQLLGKIKSFLNITWNIDSTEQEQLLDFIIGSIRRIDEIAGVELDYLNDSSNDEAYSNDYLSMCYLGRELLRNRVFYLNEKGLDDFETNYRGEVTALYLMGKVFNKEPQNAEQQ